MPIRIGVAVSNTPSVSANLAFCGNILLAIALKIISPPFIIKARSIEPPVNRKFVCRSFSAKISGGSTSDSKIK